MENGEGIFFRDYCFFKGKVIFFVGGVIFIFEDCFMVVLCMVFDMLKVVYMGDMFLLLFFFYFVIYILFNFGRIVLCEFVG